MRVLLVYQEAREDGNGQWFVKFHGLDLVRQHFIAEVIGSGAGRACYWWHSFFLAVISKRGSKKVISLVVPDFQTFDLRTTLLLAHHTAKESNRNDDRGSESAMELRIISV